MANTRKNHLEELSNSDYKIADDQPNIDNWKIVDSSGKRIGKVKDFLFDKNALKVRYLITNLKDGELVDDDRKVLIPIGKAQLNKKDDRVIVPNVNREQLASLPRYKKVDEMSQDDEYAIRNSFGGAAAAGTTTAHDKDNFYNHDDFDEDRFYDADRHNNNKGDQKVDVVEENLEVGKRKKETGGARVTSRVVERPVEERVNLREENVEVHRNKVDRPANSADLENFKEDTVEMHETKEVPVVNKEARVTEEVTLDKEVKNREEVVKDKVKKTEVDVENLDNNKNRDLTNDKNRNRDKDIDIHNTETDKMRKDSDRNRNA